MKSMLKNKSFYIGFLSCLALSSIFFFTAYNHLKQTYIERTNLESKNYELLSPVLNLDELHYSGEKTELAYRNPTEQPVVLVKENGKIDFYQLSKGDLVEMQD